MCVQNSEARKLFFKVPVTWVFDRREDAERMIRSFFLFSLILLLLLLLSI